MIPFSHTVLLWRRHRGYSQAALARASGIPQPNLSQIENGRKDVSLLTIMALSSALKVRPGALVDGVLPGHPASRITGRFSRNSLERIARAVSSDKILRDALEQSTVENLKIVLEPRLRSMRSGQNPSLKIGRKSDIAWSRLSSLPKAVLETLIERATEYAAITQSQAY